MRYRKFLKGGFDYIGAFVLSILLFPCFAVIWVLLLVELKGNPFFTQMRNGEGGIEFRVIKFRTMTNEKDLNGNLLPNDKRITRLGAIIRKTSLDEIPQLVNILKGEMSFIGPRPLPTKYFPYFDSEERSRFLVKPGISGLAQISGRNLLSWDKRIAKDLEYVELLSFNLDLKILLHTILKVLKRDNIAVDPTSVMIDFDEYKKLKNKGT